jgi:hypothetical protein
MIVGVITTRDVLLHVPTIINGFGFSCFFRCLLASFRPTPVTFLSIIYGVA